MAQPANACDVRAFEPGASVFVSANAGAGKTSLLTGRVLSLLLAGIEPGKMLCLTFTNAAAAEMESRVLGELGNWVMMERGDLSAALSKLIGGKPDERTLAHARGLFAKVLESPEGVHIQTIHGFCQSLLRRFPVEAEVSPHFAVMDARTEQEMLAEARLRLFARAGEGAVPLQQAIRRLAHDLSETSLNNLLAEIIGNKRHFRLLLATQAAIHDATDMLWKQSGVVANATVESLIAKYFVYDAFQLTALRQAADLLLQGGSKDTQTGQGLADWLASSEKTSQRADAYRRAFLTEKMTLREIIVTKKALPAELREAVMAEVERVMQFDEAWRSLVIARRSADVLLIAHALLALYDSLKQAHARMDYDDLILTASALLKRPGIAPWVLYKLDGGIDHILVDEAQDTSPEQWSIVEALTQEFYAGQGRKDIVRSLFIVGDEKQSIYRFQGADVHALGRMQDYFRQRIDESAGTAHHISLIKSYRSLPAVLSAVDAIFASARARDGLMFEDSQLLHTPTRSGHDGLVELMPLLIPDESNTSTTGRLVRQVADTIDGWLKQRLLLESKGRPVEPGDIMVLVQRRGSFVDRLSRALKRKNIPVAGIDRMALGDNLAVQDLLALGQCLLLPQDDLTLAALLKSPIGGISEEELFVLAYGRGDKSLWDRLGQSVHTQIYELLTDLRARVDFISPYELYTYLLDTRGMRRRITGRMGEEYSDPIDEFLSQALVYEQSHPPSLQGFLHWLACSESEIKRDMEQARGAVRIMTVHGAKGLQAPVVILPDTTSLPPARDSLLWDRENHIPLWPQGSRGDNALCRSLRDQERQSVYAESRRLLYVAMTRAEDQLHIFGATHHKNAPEESWYALAQEGLASIAVPFDTQHGQGLRLGTLPPKTSKAKAVLVESPIAGAEKLSFLQQPVPAEPAPSRPLTPSRLPEDEPAAASPLEKNHVHSRGLLIHALLQYLPDVPKEERQQTAQHIAGRYRHTMSEEGRAACIEEAIMVMEKGDFAFLFGADTLAEVPVAGTVTLAGRPYTVSGQIDRLCLGDEIWIIDYKTGRLPPARAEETPRHYLRQMALYRHLLAAMYPGKPIRCALLWTAPAQITELPEALLDAAAFASYI